MISTAGSAAITGWLDPIRSVLDPAGAVDWPALRTLDAHLDTVLDTHPINADLPAGPQRSRRLLTIRTKLAHHHDTVGQQPPLFQLLAQFLCGYRDLDLRDATGLGHGTLIAGHGSPAAREHWLPRLTAGELAGIALTEPHGGSRPAATRTQAVPGPAGTWRVSGRKTWISRLAEASVFTIFFRDPTGRLAAAAVDTTAPGLHRTPLAPSGLSGWTWGTLDLHDVVIQPDDILIGDGMSLLRRHFAHFRPLVTATALGGSAMIFDAVATTLGRRHTTGDLPRVPRLDPDYPRPNPRPTDHRTIRRGRRRLPRNCCRSTRRTLERRDEGTRHRHRQPNHRRTSPADRCRRIPGRHADRQDPP
jgi:Acyl-CoA dehydrogenase, middle domain